MISDLANHQKTISQISDAYDVNTFPVSNDIILFKKRSSNFGVRNGGSTL